MFDTDEKGPDMTQINHLNSEKLDGFMSDTRDGVFYISHASILVRLSGKLFLFDPVLSKPPHLGSWLFFPEMVVDRRLLKVDGVFVSHQHLDHCDVDFLSQLDASIPIFIVAGRPQFSQIFTEANLNVRELPANTKVELASGIFAVGIEHEYNKIDSAIAISNGEFTVYHGNDCFVSDEKLDIIKSEFPSVDVACVPFAYVHWYPFLLDEVEESWKKSEAERLITKYLEYGLTQVRKLNPQLAIPFGANMFFFDDVDSDHNKAVLTPFDFKEYADKVNFDLKEVIKALFAGDYAMKNPGQERLEISQAPLTSKQLKDAFREFVQKMRGADTGWDLRYLFDLPNTPRMNLSFIEERLKSFQCEKLPHRVYISNEANPDGFIEVDLMEGKAQFASTIDTSQPYHHFKLTDLAFRAYISKDFTFNEIVASSLFKLARQPNEYNLPVLNVVNNML